MATLTIRNLPEEIRDAIRVTAAKHGWSMEAEVRETLVRTFSRPMPVLSDQEKLARIDAAVRQAYDGQLPKRTVDHFLAERREAARRGE